MEEQLVNLASITQVVDPKLHQHLDDVGLEYDPDLFSMYEEHESTHEKSEGSKGKAKSTRQCGKFEERT